MNGRRLPLFHRPMRLQASSFSSAIHDTYSLIHSLMEDGKWTRYQKQPQPSFANWPVFRMFDVPLTYKNQSLVFPINVAPCTDLRSQCIKLYLFTNVDSFSSALPYSRNPLFPRPGRCCDHPLSQPVDTRPLLGTLILDLVQLAGLSECCFLRCPAVMSATMQMILS